MKRILQVILPLIMLFSMVSCNLTPAEITKTPKETEAVFSLSAEPENTTAHEYASSETEPHETVPPAKNAASNGVTVPEQEETEGNLVWVPVNGGTRYHCKATCSGMDNPMQVTVETAEANGYTPCKKCYK